MKDKLVTLFGGGGFLGRYAAQALLRAGARVRVAQRDPRQAFYLRPLGGLGQTQFVAADLARADTVARAVEGADAVVNLVGILAGDFQRVHVDGAGTIAAAATAAGVEALIQVSAIGADATGVSAYARSKAQGEAAVREAFPTATVLRPSIVFGQEDRFLNRFAAIIAKAPVVPVLRAPVRFQPVFAADVGGAIQVATAEPRRFAGMTAELGGADIVTMGELIRWLARTIGRLPTIVDLPDFVGAAVARAAFLPGAPITWDQWLMLQRDNVATPGMPGLEAFGVTPTPLEAVAPGWLLRFRRQGRFARRVDDVVETVAR